MPAKVTLTVIAGEASAPEFVFQERTTVLVGRGSDCRIRLPNHPNHGSVSRHHCLLDLNPPDVRVRDLGSLNGTLVNGKIIGRRKKGVSRDDARKEDLPEYDLRNSDLIKIGNTVLRVGIRIPATCSRCEAELTADEPTPAEILLCETCRENRAMAPVQQPKSHCSRCHQDVTSEIGSNRRGNYVCLNCRHDPFELLMSYLENANRGDKELTAIKGYTLVRELGRGGMGVVYQAVHDKTKRPVAIKVLLSSVAVEKGAQEGFLREARTTKALKHPHVVELLDIGSSGGTFFFTVEYCDGGSVDKLVNRAGGKLPLEEAVSLILQCLDGLAYAHQATIPVRLADGKVEERRGLVHRDLSPHNLFLDNSTGTRMVKIGDFGLAKAFDAAGFSGQTVTGVKAGKPYFMPRQQVIDYMYSKPEVDVWATAATLYSLLTGFTPRDFPIDKDVWQVVLTENPIHIRQRNPSIPRRIAEVIDVALIDKPGILIQTAAEFKTMLEKAL